MLIEASQHLSQTGMNRRCACNCSSEYQQNFVSPSVQWLSFEEVTSKRRPVPWGHETAIPERAAVPCRKCRSTVVQEVWPCQQGNFSSETHNITRGLSALPPASMAVGLLLLHDLMLTEGSAVYLHTQAAIKAVSLLSFRAAEHQSPSIFIQKKLIAFSGTHCQKHTLKPPSALTGTQTGSRSETDKEVERSQLPGA